MVRKGESVSISFAFEQKGSAAMDRFAVSVGESGQGRTVVTVRGELDLATADRLWVELEPLLASQSLVVLDGTGISFLDSSGLRVLLQAGKRATAESAVFRLVAPQPAVQRVLELAGASGHLQIRDSVPAALEG
jgi:anti-sigma B factor antagonist